MLWLALLVPNLPLQVFTRGLAHADTPFAVVDRVGTARILCANTAALALGVQTGQPLSTAQAVAPALQLRPRQPERETALLTEIACWAGRFTPRISLAPPDTVLLEIQASLRLFGGQARIEHELGKGLAQLGVSARLACAPTPLAARWLAACGQGLPASEDWQRGLDALPLAVLGSEGDCSTATLELLHGLGARTLGDVRALPAAGLARRQAQSVSLLLARARGEQPDPRLWFAPPERFHHELALPAPTHNSEALLFAARRLFASLASWLQARHAAIDHCRLRLIHERQPATTLDIILGQAANDEAHLALIARERLDSLPLPAEVCALGLDADHLLAHAPRAEDLFGAPGQARDQAMRLVDRLRARLGEDAIRQLAPVADHRPEAAWQSQAQAQPGRRRATTPSAASNPDAALPDRQRPFWLLPQATAISPQHYTLLGDAERIESGWWDDGDVRRDYYLAQRSDNTLCWIYHELAPPGGWYLQGYFG